MVFVDFFSVPFIQFTILLFSLNIKPMDYPCVFEQLLKCDFHAPRCPIIWHTGLS